MKSFILLFTLSFGILINAQTIALRKATSNELAIEKEVFVPSKYATETKQVKRVKRIDAMIPLQMKKNMATYMALQSAKYHLDRYLKDKNKESLQVLTSGWSIEDQILVKQDLAKLDRSLKVEVKGNSLILKTRQGMVNLHVEDALQGRYRINDKSLLITSYRRYEVVKKEISAAIGIQEQARFQLINLFITPAHAIGFLAPLAPVVAPTATAAAVAKTVAVAKFVGMHIALPLAVGGAGAYIANKYLAHDFARNLAYYNPDRVLMLMCSGEMSPTAHFNRERDCATIKKSDMEVEIKRPDKIDELFALPAPKLDRKCEKTNEGFTRDTGITFHKKSANGDLKVNQIESTHRLRFEFVSNPKDPKKLITKTMIETIYNKEGQREGQRVWTFEEDNFVVREYSNEQLNKLETALYKHSVAPTVYDCTGKKLTEDEVCKKLDKGLLAAAKSQVSCTMDNPEQVIEQIKAEKQDEMNSKRASRPSKAASATK